jgi:hypothetical protein
VTVLRRGNAQRRPSAQRWGNEQRRGKAQRHNAAVVLAAAAILTAGCGATRAAHPPVAADPPAPSLATSLVTTAGAWTVVPMGGSPAFWQLFRYPPTATGWSVVTPPGVADNGGLVLADPGGQSLVAGFRPSKDLAFTPLAATADSGKTWSPGILDAALADVPDALAAGPGGHLLALLGNGTAVQSASTTGAAGWSPLTSERALAAAPDAHACALRGLTAAAFSTSGVPLLAGDCARPGTAGIFALAGGAWHAVGPALPPSLAGHAVSTLRLATSGGRTVALLQSGTGRAANLLAAWTTDAGAHWTLAAPLALGGAHVRSAGLGAGGALWLMLAGGPAQTSPAQAAGAETISGPGGSWRALQTLPAGTATLAMDSSGQFHALVTHGATLTDWRLNPGASQWHRAQTINVPIQFGSSG